MIGGIAGLLVLSLLVLPALFMIYHRRGRAVSADLDGAPEPGTP